MVRGLVVIAFIVAVAIGFSLPVKHPNNLQVARADTAVAD